MVRFLIIRFSSIGDVVLTTPVIRTLKQEIQEVEIHYLIKKEYAQILQSNPNIDKIHCLQESLNDTINSLQEIGFDYIIDLQNSIRSMQIKRALKRMYFTVNKINLRKWIYINFKIDLLPDKHIVDRYLETLKSFGIKEDSKGLDFFIREKDQVDLQNEFTIKNNRYIALVIGAQHFTKKLPEDRIAKLIDLLELPVILIGGPEDEDPARRILAKCKKDNIHNGCGKWNINQSASVIQQSSLVITHDTGMMHIAAALDKIILSIWGNTTPKLGMYPYKPQAASEIFEVKGLSCRPCSKLGKQSCPKKHFKCMLDQNLSAIAEKANTLAG